MQQSKAARGRRPVIKTETAVSVAFTSDGCAWWLFIMATASGKTREHVDMFAWVAGICEMAQRPPDAQSRYFAHSHDQRSKEENSQNKKIGISLNKVICERPSDLVNLRTDILRGMCRLR